MMEEREPLDHSLIHDPLEAIRCLFLNVIKQAITDTEFKPTSKKTTDILKEARHD